MKAHLATSGYWKIGTSDITYSGDLYRNEEEGGIFIYISVPNSGPPGSYFEIPLQIEYIQGTAINGAEMTLLNCSRIAMESKVGLEDVYGYQVDYMLENVSFEKQEDIVFSKLQIQVPGVVKWGAISNYGRTKNDGYRNVIKLQEVKDVSIYSDSHYDLSYSLIPSFPWFDFMKEEITLKQSPYLIIKSTQPQSLFWFIEIALKMKNMIEIAMGKPLSFGKMTAESPSIVREIEGRETRKEVIDIKHFLFSENKDEEIEYRGVPFLFNLVELHESGDFYAWQRVSTLLEPVIELYIDDLYNQSLSTNRHFLNMSQALETYHSRMICDGNFSDYKERVERIISNQYGSSREKAKRFLTEGSRGKITFRNRIADLFLADFQFFFYTGDIKELDFPQVIANTRNFYTHYNQTTEKKALKGSDLEDAYRMLRSILEYYLLRELGFNEEFISKRIRDRTQPLEIRNSIRHTEKNKN